MPQVDGVGNLIEPVPPSSTPAEPGVPREKPVRRIPNDLLEEASNRLGILSLVCAVLWGVGTVLYRLAIAHLGHPFHAQTPDGIAVLASLISVGLYVYTRRSRTDPGFLLDLGLVYLVLTAFALGVVLHWDEVPPDTIVLPQISWIGALTLMFAALVPTAPTKMLVTGLIAVSMTPLGMLIAKARGAWDFGPAINVLVMHYPDYLIAGVAALISRVITKLGQQVSKAREMGSYKLVSRLGKGGMGEVWRARHTMLARDAAIKLIQPAMLIDKGAGGADIMKRRFAQEAKATAMLRSPHTVELYDYGVTADGVFYYVMELLDGIDLDTLVRRFGPQPPARVIYIMTQVCRSLADAHQHGMIHRDIKPSNIFLCRMGNEYDFAKVLDFGLVKMPEGGETITGEGVPRGTPAYLAPEIAQGKTDLDGRTDLYGLGCVAYWLLTGRLVFEEKGAMAMILAHVNATPGIPSKLSPVDLPAALDGAIMACLAKSPRDRPASGEALAAMLESCQGLDPWTRHNAESWWRLHLPAEAAQRDEPLSPRAESVTVTKGQ